MKTVEHHSQIRELLNDIDTKATKAINAGLKFTVEYRDNGITEKQFDSLHVWIRWCVKYLNERALYRCAPITARPIPWTELIFKEDVYKVVLKRWKNKHSTKRQNTIDPEEIRLAISGHMATAYNDNIQLPEWPSAR